MKNVLCYGDSNTYGWDPQGLERFDETKRWPRIMAKLLGDGYHVIEEGLNGRTTVFHDPVEPGRCGRDYLIPCLQSHEPLDLVIIMLGTNDMKRTYSPTALSIAGGMEALIKIIKNPYQWRSLTPPSILVISPILIGDAIAQAQIQNSFGPESVIISKQLASEYKQVAEKYGCYFLDAAHYADPSALDDIHLDAENCQKLAAAVADMVKFVL